MKITRIGKIEQFEKLKKGDFVLVEWNDYAVKHDKKRKKIMGYNIIEFKRDAHEIILRKAGNHYFNYEMVIEGRSSASEVLLVEMKNGD